MVDLYNLFCLFGVFQKSGRPMNKNSYDYESIITSAEARSCSRFDSFESRAMRHGKWSAIVHAQNAGEERRLGSKHTDGDGTTHCSSYIHL